MSRKRIVLAVAAALLTLSAACTKAEKEPAPPPAPSATPSTSPPPSPGADITGPLDLLLVGVDTRTSIPDWEPHADTIMLLHLEAGLETGYLYSLPRDLRVKMPAFPAAGFRGGTHKITEAMSRGSRVAGSKKPDPKQGYELLRRTVVNYTGVKIDAGAVLTFTGLSRLTDALGGVRLRIDTKVLSQHRRPDGTLRTMRRGGGGYVGPQATYLPGTRTLKGWQALDYARQRYGLKNGDYDRQRHQRQLVTALLAQVVSTGVTEDPAKLDGVIRALGDTLTYSGGRQIVEFAYALRNLQPGGITMVSLPGASVGNGGGYLGEQLQPLGREFLKAVAADRPGPFLASHPQLRHK